MSLLERMKGRGEKDTSPAVTQSDASGAPGQALPRSPAPEGEASLPEGEDRWIPTAAAVLCDALLLRSCFLFVSLLDQEGAVVRLPSVLPWAAASLAVWGLWRLFTLRPRAVPALLLAGTAGAAAQLWAVLSWGGGELSGPYPLLLGLLVLAGAFHGGWLLFHPVGDFQTSLYLDFGALLFLYFLLVPSPWPEDPLLLHLLLVMGVSLLSLAYQRLSGGRKGARGGGLLGVLAILWGAALAVGAAAVFLIFFSESAGQALVAILSAVEAVIEAALDGVGAVLSFLLSLLPEGEAGGSPYLDPVEIAGPGAELPPEEAGEGSAILGAIFLGGGALLVLWAAGSLLWRLRKVRLGGRAPGAGPALRRSRGDFLLGVKLWLRETGRSLRLRWLCFIRRDTPAGTLAWLERWGWLRGMGRRRGETIRSYLERLAAAGEERGDPESAAGLRRLAGWLELRCYSPDPPPPPSKEELRALRRPRARTQPRP